MKDLYSFLNESSDAELARNLLKMARGIKTHDEDTAYFIACGCESDAGKRAVTLSKADASWRVDNLIEDMEKAGWTMEIDGETYNIECWGTIFSHQPEYVNIQNAYNVTEFAIDPITKQKDWRSFISKSKPMGVTKSGYGDYNAVVQFGRQKLKR